MVSIYPDCDATTLSAGHDICEAALSHSRAMCYPVPSSGDPGLAAVIAASGTDAINSRNHSALLGSNESTTATTPRNFRCECARSMWQNAGGKAGDPPGDCDEFNAAGYAFMVFFGLCTLQQIVTLSLGLNLIWIVLRSTQDRMCTVLRSKNMLHLLCNASSSVAILIYSACRWLRAPLMSRRAVLLVEQISLPIVAILSVLTMAAVAIQWVNAGVNARNFRRKTAAKQKLFGTVYLVSVCAFETVTVVIFDAILGMSIIAAACSVLALILLLVVYVWGFCSLHGLIQHRLQSQNAGWSFIAGISKSNSNLSEVLRAARWTILWMTIYLGAVIVYIVGLNMSDGAIGERDGSSVPWVIGESFLFISLGQINLGILRYFRRGVRRLRMESPRAINRIKRRSSDVQASQESDSSDDDDDESRGEKKHIAKSFTLRIFRRASATLRTVAIKRRSTLNSVSPGMFGGAPKSTAPSG